MSYLRFSTGTCAVAALAALPAFGTADTYVIRRDNVIPVVFEDKLTVHDNVPGDIFRARVTDTNQLPPGSELEGRIDRIHRARGNRPASMDLRFTELLLPDRSRMPLDAAPIPLDDRYITRYGDGRIVAKQNIRQQQNDILGGAIGGFIVGSILHRRIAGTIIGAMVGTVAASNQHAEDNNVIVTSGQKVGALFNRDLTIDFNAATLPSTTDMNRSLDREMDGPVRNYGSRMAVNLRFRYDGQDLVFPADALPYRLGRTVMVPLEPTAHQLHLDVDRRSDRTIYVGGLSGNIRLTLDSREARVGGRRFDLPRTVLEINGVVYAPLDALLPVLKHDLFLNDRKVEPVD